MRTNGNAIAMRTPSKNKYTNGKKKVLNFQPWWTHAKSKERVMGIPNANCHCWIPYE